MGLIETIKNPVFIGIIGIVVGLIIFWLGFTYFYNVADKDLLRYYGAFTFVMIIGIVLVVVGAVFALRLQGDSM